MSTPRRGDRTTPPRRPPPPPPRLPHHGPPPHILSIASIPVQPVWPPRGPLGRPPFPPRPPAQPITSSVPPPPWAIPARPAPPPLPMRPPMQQAMVYRPPLPFPRPPRFIYPPRSGRAPRAPIDLDSHWLAEFTEKHLDQTITATTEPELEREPPLRRIRERLAEMLSKLSDLESRAHELIELEKKILTVDVSEDELVLSRLKIQAERKRSECEQLRAALDHLQDPGPFGLGTSVHRDALAFTKRILKKKAYRLRRKQTLRAEHTIREGLQEQEPTNRNAVSRRDSQEISNYDPSTCAGPAMDDPNAAPAARRARRSECEAARKILIALDLRESQRGNELTETERKEIHEARDLATSCLQKKRKRRRRRTNRATKEPNREIPAQPQEPSITQSATIRSLALPLRDPSAVDMETLISMRRLWDSYLVPQTVNGASAISPHFVAPPAKPSARWAQFSVLSKADEHAF